MKPQKEGDFKEGVEIVLIKHFYQESEAHLYAAKLKDEGIDSFLSNTNMNTALTVDFANVGLHVNKKDVRQASLIIEGLDLQQASRDPNFSYEDATPEEIELEKGLLAANQKKSDNIFYLIAILLLIVGIILAIINYFQQV